MHTNELNSPKHSLIYSSHFLTLLFMFFGITVQGHVLAKSQLKTQSICKLKTLTVSDRNLSLNWNYSKNAFKTLVTSHLVVQVAKDIKKHYLNTLPLANASESFLDDLVDVQKNVGNLVCVCMCSSSIFMQFIEKSQTEAFKSCKNIKAKTTTAVNLVCLGKLDWSYGYGESNRSA